MLFLTHTTVSVSALTGAIMCMGVATANSVLVISFAGERMNAGDDAFKAALQAGFTRLRPVLMTALAMIIGMIPMAPGLGAELRFAEQPGRQYAPQTVHTSNSLDPNLRTLQVELQLDNAKQEIFPGAYVEVHFKRAGNARVLRIPANSVLFRAAGLQVATVDGDRDVKLKSIFQGRDFGNSVEVLSGIGPEELIVLNPPHSLTEGEAVRVAAPPPEGSKDKGKGT